MVEMTDQEAREFVELLAFPQATDPPPCPICGHGHSLETRCVLSNRADSLKAAGLRE